MGSLDEQILKAAKEIVVKFIEGGRVSPTGFTEVFQQVYGAIDATVRNAREIPEAGRESKSGGG